jgi:hypothetical protein
MQQNFRNYSEFKAIYLAGVIAAGKVAMLSTFLVAILWLGET